MTLVEKVNAKLLDRIKKAETKLEMASETLKYIAEGGPGLDEDFYPSIAQGALAAMVLVPDRPDPQDEIKLPPRNLAGEVQTLQDYVKGLERELELRQAFMESKGFFYRYQIWRAKQDLGLGEEPT